MFTKEQALAIDVVPSITDTADAEIFYWQLTGMEWDGRKSSYHSQATKRWRKLRRPAEAATARAAYAARQADKRRLLKWAEDLDLDICLRVIQMTTFLIEQVSRYTTLLSDDLSSCHSQLLEIIEMLEPSIHPVVIPLVERDTVNRAVCVGQAVRLVLGMLDDMEDQVGVHSEDRPSECDLFERWRCICEACLLSDCWRGDSGRSHASIQADKERELALFRQKWPARRT